MNKSKILIISIFSLIILVILMILLNNKRIINEKANKLTKLDFIPVSVYTVKYGDITENISFVATAYPNKEINISSEISGKITKIDFAEGSYVQSGQLLVQIDDELKISAYENTKALYEKAERDLNRNKELYSNKSISDAQMEAAQLNYENAKHQFNIAKKQLKDTKILAPFSGFITQKFVDLGSFVNVGNPIANLVDISILKVRSNISEKDAFKLKKGDLIKLTSDVFPNKIFIGNISYISPKSDDGHTYTVEILLNNANHELKAGMIFNANLNFNIKQNKLIIPRDAIIGSIKNPYVFIVENEVAVIKYIKVGNDVGNFIQVIDGLKEGDKVVVKGKINIVDGSKVKTTEEI